MSAYKFEATVNYRNEDIIDIVQNKHKSHVKQVAYSTFHNALTMICFSCQEIHSSIAEEDFQEGNY